MSIEYIRYRIPAQQQSVFLDDYRQAVTSLDQSPFCLAYEMSRCEEESERFILRIEWTSSEDHLQRFRQSAEFRAFLPLVRPYVEFIEEMQHYRPTNLVARK